MERVIGGRLVRDGHGQPGYLREAFEDFPRLGGLAELAEALRQADQVAGVVRIAFQQLSITPGGIVHPAVLPVQVRQQLPGVDILLVQGQRAGQVNLKAAQVPQPKADQGQSCLQVGVLGTVGGGVATGAASRLEISHREVQPAQGQPRVGRVRPRPPH